MPSARAVRAGGVYVEVYGDDSRLQRTLKRARRRLRAFGASARALGASMFAATAGVLAPITAVSVKAASDAQEIRNRFRQVFRDQADAAGKFADDLGDAVGRSGTKLRGTLSDFQGFFVGLGFGADQARELSQRMTELSLDFASFNNLSDQEAAGRFISALSGSGEVLDRFGINIKQSALGLELQRKGMADSVQSATELQKAIARVSIITRSMTDQGAIGDATRTSGQFANQMRSLRDEFFELRVAIGEAVLPLATKFIRTLNGAIKGVTAFIAKNGDLVRNVLAVGAGFAVAGAAVFAFGVAITAVSALISSPFAVAAASAVALAVGIDVLTGAATGSAGVIRRSFKSVESDLSEVINAMASDLRRGDIGAAVKLLADSILLPFQEAMLQLRKTWVETLRSIFSLVKLLPVGGEGIFSILSADLDRETREINKKMLDLGVKVADQIKRANPVQAAVDEARKAVDEIAKQTSSRATGGVSPVGSLSAFSALQRLAGASQDKLVQSVTKIENTAKRIEQNTRTGVVFE